MNGEIKCIHAVFDKFWKKYKCAVYQHVIFVPDTCNGCVRRKEKEISNEKTNIN